MKEQYTDPGGQLRFQPAFEQCRRQAFLTVTTNLAELLRQADDALLDFADQAQTNSIQQEFFAALGVIRTHRPLVQSLFQTCFNKAFDDLGKRVPLRASGGTEDAKEESDLSLLSVVDMDENVAAETLVNKAKDGCYTELYALRQRLSVVAGGRQLGEDEIPAGPYHLVHCFRSALQGLDVDVKVRMILYALFDKYVMKDVEALYRELNEGFKKAGVLPNLKYLINPHKNADAARSIAPEDGADGRHAEQQSKLTSSAKPTAGPESEQSAEPRRGVSDELMGAILHLMAGRRAQLQASAASDGAALSGRFGAAVSRVQRETLIDTINRVQSRSRARDPSAFTDPVAAARLGSDPHFVDSVKAELAAERDAFFSQVKPQQMEPVDVDAIDIVGLLFEYMLNDPVLPNLAKALLSRLHTPYLKVALLDRQLLYDDDHCARQLLDLLVEAGETYVRESVPAWGIFPTLRIIVERVLAEFTDKLSLFDELLALLKARVKEQERKTTTLEERARQAAIGRDRFHEAKQRAAAEIEQRISDPYVLPEVADFLSKVWLHAMVFLLLRSPFGESGKDWLQALEVADQLANLGKESGLAASRHQLKTTLPSLLGAIEAGLDSLGGNRPGAWLTLAPLLTDHERLLRRVEEVRAAARPRPESMIALKPVVEEVVPEVRAPEEKGGRPAASSLSANEAKMIARLRALQFGTWFEFKPEEGRPPRRLKMAWFSTFTETCLFVDREGMQAETRTMLSLAQDLLAQRARIITFEKKKPFVARALSAILSMLKASAPAASEPVQGRSGQGS
jgi:hypothetical protein